MTTESDDDRPKLTDVLVPMGMGAAVLALALLAAAGTGYRLGLWSFMAGFRVFGLAAWLGLGAAGVSLWSAYLVRGMLPRSQLYKALFGVALGVIVAVIPWQWQQTVAKLPYIHDITTDMINPPVFVTLLATRADAPNSSEYGGSKIAAQQKDAYPDIEPVVLEVSADEAFARAEAVVRQLGWDVAALIAAEGRIEATDTTTWFGFKDDVVIRVRPVDGHPGSTRIDARSVSRVGMSDVGANADRLRAFIARVRN
jgi:uncharacterized protein (DUF1499 family)